MKEFSNQNIKQQGVELRQHNEYIQQVKDFNQQIIDECKNINNLEHVEQLRENSHSSIIKKRKNNKIWNLIQNTRIFIFATKFSQMIKEKEISDKGFYSLMSRYIKSKSNNECKARINHLVNYFGSFQLGMNYLKFSHIWGRSLLKQQVKRFQQFMKRQMSMEYNGFNMFKRNIQNKSKLNLCKNNNNKITINQNKTCQKLLKQISLQQTRQDYQNISTKVIQNVQFQVVVQFQSNKICIQEEKLSNHKINQINQQKRSDDINIVQLNQNSENIKFLEQNESKILSQKVSDFYLQSDGKQSELYPHLIKQNKQKKYQFRQQPCYKIWSNSQLYLLILFCAINSKILISQNKSQRRQIFVKMKKYVNTQKTAEDCYDKYYSILRKYSYQFLEMIKIERQRFQITQQKLYMQNRYLLTKQSLIHDLGMNIQSGTIVFKEDNKQDDIMQKRRTFEIEVPISIIIQVQQNELMKFNFSESMEKGFIQVQQKIIRAENIIQISFKLLLPLQVMNYLNILSQKILKNEKTQRQKQNIKFYQDNTKKLVYQMTFVQNIQFL